MPVPTNPELYERAKNIVFKIYTSPSAYRSGALVKKYKELGGKYKEDGKEKNLKRWFREKWTDVNPKKTTNSYPVYRPTVRVNKKTPLTVHEVDARDLKRKSELKQKLKTKHLPAFQRRRRSSRSSSRR